MTPRQVFLWGLLMLGSGCIFWIVRALAVAFGPKDTHPYTVWRRKGVEPLLLVGLVATVVGGIWVLVS